MVYAPKFMGHSTEKPVSKLQFTDALSGDWAADLGRPVHYVVIATSTGRDALLLHDIEMFEPREHVAPFRLMAFELNPQAQVVDAVGVAQRVFVAD
jgi:hypothetical protein